MLVLSPHAPERLELPGASATVEIAGRGAAGFELTFGLFERRDADGTCRGLDGVVEYRTDRFHRSTVESLCTRFTQLLRTAAATPDIPVHDIDLDLSAPKER
jgi:pristinamycin I synthase-2